MIGASGMIGNAVMRALSEKKEWRVFGSVRNEDAKRFFSPMIGENIMTTMGLEQSDGISEILNLTRPNVVINCAGLTKHKTKVEDPLVSIPINTLLPHRLASLCTLIGARLIHVSTDCVFSGLKGKYTENDSTDAVDVYGKSKALGEVDSPHVITLRTSTIGHEFQSNHGLLEWFLSQEDSCKGFVRAVFSGMPSIVFAQVIRDVIIPQKSLSGLYHVGADPINKFDLLQLISRIYKKDINILRDEKLVIDRSLDSTKLKLATGYIAPEWPEMIKLMLAYK